MPYKGSGPSINDLIGGQVMLTMDSLVQSYPHIKAGRLKALAVLSPKRTALLPDVPTIGETLPGYEFETWFGMIAPAGTPAPIVALLNAEFRRVLALPEIRERLQNEGGMRPVGGSAPEFAALIASDKNRWGKLAREAGARVD